MAPRLEEMLKLKAGGRNGSVLIRSVYEIGSPHARRRSTLVIATKGSDGVGPRIHSEPKACRRLTNKSGGTLLVKPD
jgi:hypothetical protein